MIYFLFLVMYSLRKKWPSFSSPQALKEMRKIDENLQSLRRGEMNSVSGFELTVTTTHEQPTTFLALPSLSILHKPDHSPSFLLSSTFNSQK